MAKKKVKQISLVDQVVNDIIAMAALAQVEPAKLTIAQYNKHKGRFNTWELRKAGGFAAIKKAYFEKDLPKDRVATGEVKETKKYYASIEKELENREVFTAKLKEAVDNMPAIKMKPYKFKAKSYKSGKVIKRVVNALLSDLHFGSDIDHRETGIKWGKIEEARCFARVVKNICSYKSHYRSETKLVANILGDIIENVLHGTGSQAPIHEQACRAIHLLSQGIARFSEAFAEVEINFAVGNHGRDVGIHHGRATSQKWNAVETTIYYAVKKACGHLKNVKFNQPLTPWVTYEAMGHKIYTTHGDTNFSIGNPGNAISIRSIETQVNRLNSNLKDDDKYAVIAFGHVHLALSTQLPNGAYIIMNGALVPPNPYAQTLGIMKSPQNQVIWESTEGFAVGDQRFINCSGAETDKSLDSYIAPFEGIEY